MASTSSGGGSAPRVPLKAAAGGASSSSARRRSMTERRMELSNKIRKKSRSQALALKRRLGSSAAAAGGVPAATNSTMAGAEASGAGPAVGSSSAADPVSLKIVDLASSYVRSCRYSGGGGGGEQLGVGDAGCLSALQAALAKSDADGRSTDSLLIDGSSSSSDASSGGGDGNTPAFLLCESLSTSLASPLSTDEVRLDASRVLTNLAATGGGSSSSDGGEDDYYGAATERWCDVIVRSSALPALIGAADTFSRSVSAAAAAGLAPLPATGAAALCEQCAWAIGNVGGDSQRARDAARDASAIPVLVRALRAGFNFGRRGESGGVPPMVGLCRNAAWALSNLARGAYTSAGPFLSSSNASGDDGLLTPQDLSELLAADVIVLREAGPKAVGLGRARGVSVDGVAGPDAVVEVPDATWLDVASEVLWVVAFLSAREDAAVDFLLGSPDTALCESLAYRLSRASEEVSGGEGGEEALRMCVPCIRIVGNAAAACDGRHVARLAQTFSIAGSGGPQFSTIPASLARLIQLGSSQGGDCATVASEAAWAAGTLLCDAGPPPPHPSTAACDVLLPALCQAVISGMAKLELKREAVCAIGNAAAVPPAPPGTDQSAAREATLPVRQRLLASIAECDGFVAALTRLLLSFDADAVFASVQLVDALLRVVVADIPAVRRLFEEADCPDALEKVCDRASTGAAGSASEQSAEIAANLIDDIFEEDILAKDDDANGAFPAGTTATAAGEVRYAFGVNSAGAAATGGFDFSGGAGRIGQVSQAPPLVSGMGRGRGRGKVIPSWMQQQKS